MIILGIDQGIASSGYAIISGENPDNIEIVEYGEMKTYPDGTNEDMPDRVYSFYKMVRDIINQFKPEEICCEKLFHNAPTNKGRNKSASITNTNIASGIIMLNAAENEIHFREYPPTTVKKRITGNGRAKKEDIKKSILEKYPGLKEFEKEMSEHEFDAIAIAITSFMIQHGIDT